MLLELKQTDIPQFLYDNHLWKVWIIHRYIELPKNDCEQRVMSVNEGLIATDLVILIELMLGLTQFIEIV